MVLTKSVNPFEKKEVKKVRNRTRSWNNSAVQLVRDFAASDLDCAIIPHTEYRSYNQLAYTLSHAIKTCKDVCGVESHCYKGNVYLFKSKAIDREKFNEYYKGKARKAYEVC